MTSTGSQTGSSTGSQTGSSTGLPAGLTLREVNLRDAIPDQYAALNEFEDVLRRESRPDDPPKLHEERVAEWRSMPDFIGVTSWMVQD
ncbi:MAG TPA: hypothetical protein VNT60_09735, partial [Deinococcales bacterium]|nr:hypothetical protein [Deinococcales bacterium]